MSRPARGDVWLGARRSPTVVWLYIVLTRDEAIEQLGEVIVVPLTTTVRRLPNEVELDDSDGLPRACVTSLDNLSTIAKGQLVGGDHRR